jgi:hypothetical protein
LLASSMRRWSGHQRKRHDQDQFDHGRLALSRFPGRPRFAPPSIHGTGDENQSRGTGLTGRGSV